MLYDSVHQDEILAFLFRKNFPYSTKCFYCGMATRKSKPQNVRPGNQKFRSKVKNDTRTKDHIYPKSLGGMSTVISCFGCNQAKQDMTLDEFRERIISGFKQDSHIFYGEVKMQSKGIRYLEPQFNSCL